MLNCYSSLVQFLIFSVTDMKVVRLKSPLRGEVQGEFFFFFPHCQFGILSYEFPWSTIPFPCPGATCRTKLEGQLGGYFSKPSMCLIILLSCFFFVCLFVCWVGRGSFFSLLLSCCFFPESKSCFFLISWCWPSSMTNWLSLSSV